MPSPIPMWRGIFTTYLMDATSLTTTKDIQTPFSGSNASYSLQSACSGLNCSAAGDDLSEEPIGDPVPHARRAKKLQTAPRHHHRGKQPCVIFSLADPLLIPIAGVVFPIDPTALHSTPCRNIKQSRTTIWGPEWSRWREYRTRRFLISPVLLKTQPVGEVGADLDIWIYTDNRVQNDKLQGKQQEGEEACGSRIQKPLAAASSQYNPFRRRPMDAEPAEAVHGILPRWHP